MADRLRRAGAAFFGVIKSLASGIYHHDCLGLAAQVAYSILFSLFPFLLFLQALAAYITGTSVLTDWLLGGLRQLITVDSELYRIVKDNVFGEVGGTSATLLSIGVVLTLWSASGAIMTLIKAVNVAYGLKESRSWQKRRTMAAGLAIGGAVLIPLGILLLVFGTRLDTLIVDHFGQGSTLHLLWSALRWPVVFIALVGAMGAFFWVAPSGRHKWYSTLPGALFAVAAIIGTSAALSWFVSQTVLKVTWLSYGAIGTVIVLLFWAFLGALMVLVGVEINAVILRSVAARREAKARLVESADD
jgi:membrane protein